MIRPNMYKKYYDKNILLTLLTLLYTIFTYFLIK